MVINHLPSGIILQVLYILPLNGGVYQPEMWNSNPGREWFQRSLRICRPRHGILSPSFRARNFNQKIWVNHQFPAIKPWMFWPQIQIRCLPKTCFKHQQKRVDPTKSQRISALTIIFRKEKKISKTPCPPRVENLPTDPTTTTDTRTSPRLRTRRCCSTHLERTHLLRQLVEATASIQALQNVRNIDDLGRLTGWLAGWHRLEVPAALRIPSCWALFGVPYLTSSGGRVVAFLGGELGRFSCAKCGKLGKFSACLFVIMFGQIPTDVMSKKKCSISVYSSSLSI